MIVVLCVCVTIITEGLCCLWDSTLFYGVSRHCTLSTFTVSSGCGLYTVASTHCGCCSCIYGSILFYSCI